jgi:hypothetical protein
MVAIILSSCFFISRIVKEHIIKLCMDINKDKWISQVFSLSCIQIQYPCGFPY